MNKIENDKIIEKLRNDLTSAQGYIDRCNIENRKQYKRILELEELEKLRKENNNFIKYKQHIEQMLLGDIYII